MTWPIVEHPALFGDPALDDSAGRGGEQGAVPGDWSDLDVDLSGRGEQPVVVLVEHGPEFVVAVAEELGR